MTMDRRIALETVRAAANYLRAIALEPLTLLDGEALPNALAGRLVNVAMWMGGQPDGATDLPALHQERSQPAAGAVLVVLLQPRGEGPVADHQQVCAAGSGELPPCGTVDVPGRLATGDAGEDRSNGTASRVGRGTAPSDGREG